MKRIHDEWIKPIVWNTTAWAILVVGAMAIKLVVASDMDYCLKVIATLVLSVPFVYWWAALMWRVVKDLENTLIEWREKRDAKV